MSETWLGYLLSGGALVCFASATLATPRATTLMPLSLGFLVATAVNVVFAALALGVQMLVQQAPLGWDGQAFWYFVAAGVLATYLGRWFFYESVVLFGPAKASIFQVSNPLFTALIAWLFLRETLQPAVLVAMVMAIAGLLIISAKPRPGKAQASRASSAASPASPDAGGSATALHRGWWAGAMQSILFLGMGSSLAYGVSNVLRASAIRDWNEPILGGLLGATSGLLMHLIFARGKRAIVASLQEANRRGVWLYALIGACTISGQILTIGAMRFIPVALATLMPLCAPLLVIPLSRLIDTQPEPITGRLLLGAGLTLAGVMVVVMR